MGPEKTSPIILEPNIDPCDQPITIEEILKDKFPQKKEIPGQKPPFGAPKMGNPLDSAPSIKTPPIIIAPEIEEEDRLKEGIECDEILEELEQE